MKKSYILIAVAMVAALTMVSCKNNKSQEPTQEEIEAQKIALADSVMAKVDAIANQFIDASKESFTFRSRMLTEQEKAIKPDYLFDPSEVTNLTTTPQKARAIGIMIIDLGVRYLYEMPIDETKEAISRLALEINMPTDVLSASANQQDISEIHRKIYNNCKENNKLDIFWQCCYAIVIETCYIIAQNPDLFFSKITENEHQAFSQTYSAVIDAIEELAKYDEEMASLLELRNESRLVNNDEQVAEVYSSLESTKQFVNDKKDKNIARRNALLQ